MLQLGAPWVDGHDIDWLHTLRSNRWWHQSSYYTVLPTQRWLQCLITHKQTEEGSNSLRSPIPESKSGMAAASVIINSCRFLRRILQFWGSSDESVGCGHRTFVPSFDSFNRAATATPSSFSASLDMLTWSIWWILRTEKHTLGQ